MPQVTQPNLDLTEFYQSVFYNTLITGI